LIHPHLLQVNVLREAKEVVPPELMAFGTAVKKKTHAMYGDHFRNDDRPMKAAVKVKLDLD
jgi:ATP-dependent RNA helicase DBP3